jgi:ribosomal protein S7
MINSRKVNSRKYIVKCFIGTLTRGGNKSKAKNIFCSFLSDIEYKYQVDAIAFLDRFINIIRPKVYLIPKKVAGSTVRVPLPISTNRSYSIAVKWFISSVSKKSGEPFNQLLMFELIDVFNNPLNSTLKKRDEYHKLAKLNRPFMRFVKI